MTKEAKMICSMAVDLLFSFFKQSGHAMGQRKESFSINPACIFLHIQITVLSKLENFNSIIVKTKNAVNYTFMLKIFGC